MDLLYEYFKGWSVFAIVALLICFEVMAEFFAEIFARPLANKIKKILGINGKKSE